MTTVSALDSAALQILRQPVSLTAEKRDGTGTDDLVAIANGQTAMVAVDRQPTAAASQVSEAMFSVNNVSVNQMKLDLIDKTGKALGVDQDDYGSRDDFVDAMRQALGRLKLEGGPMAVMGLEKELGLDKLGVSIEDVIESARDPEANDKLTKALERDIGKTEDEDENLVQRLAARPNEIGLYGTANH